MEQFDDIKELIRLEPNHKVDLLIDLLAESERMIKDPTLFAFSDKYLEQTDYLDKYGYEFELEESDLTEKSDRGYEMDVDSYLYK